MLSSGRLRWKGVVDSEEVRLSIVQFSPSIEKQQKETGKDERMTHRCHRIRVLAYGVAEERRRELDEEYVPRLR
jgi:hypothetical protein